MAIKHTIRTKDGGTREVMLTRAKAIHLKCVDCSGFMEYEVRKCWDYKCPIYPYRTGRGAEIVAREAEIEGSGE